MLRHLLCGQGRFADSASKTHTPPANPRRTPLCHPDHYLKRKERRQAVGLLRTPFKRMAVGLRTTGRGCLFIFDIASPGRVRQRPVCVDVSNSAAMYMLRHLLCGQGRFADSASKTHTPPANLRRTPLCHPDHHFKRKERWQAVGLIRSPFKWVGVGRSPPNG